MHKNNMPIMIVDDNKANREIIKYFLKDIDILEKNIYFFENGYQAYDHIASLQTEIPKLLITDLKMPKLDGFNLLTKVKRNRNIYSIVVTGFGNQENLKTAFELGAMDFVRKPIEKIELQARIKNIIKIINYENTLKHLSSIDFLTKAYNRKYFIKQVNKEIRRSYRYKQPLSLLVIDIDNFKNINDSYGHTAGDKVLKIFCRLCNDLLRESDYFCRYGGDEFVICLVHTNIEQAEQVAERIRQQTKTLKVNYEEKIICFTISIGCTEYLQNNETTANLIRRADQALYVAKEKGKDILRIG